MIYKIAFKDGSELPSTIHYMKNLIKATIDIYKEQQNIDAVNPSDMIWRDKENAALKIIREGGIGNQLIDYKQLPPDIKASYDKLIDNVFKSIGKIHDLGLMTENLGDQITRK